MLSILKTFGLGLLYTVLSPFIVFILALYFVYTFITFIIMFFINIFKFFKGKSITDKLPIDIEAEKILLAQEQYEAKFNDAIINNQVMANTPMNNMPQNNVTYTQTQQVNNVPPMTQVNNDVTSSNSNEGGEAHD